MDIQIIKSNKGGDKLCLDGFMYTVLQKKKDYIRWKCVKYSSMKVSFFFSLISEFVIAIPFLETIIIGIIYNKLILKSLCSIYKHHPKFQRKIKF